MRCLAIETVASSGSVAALRDGRLLHELALDPSRRSAQTLAPALAELLRAMAWKPSDVELIAVAEGPGSFTGLRVGVTTAKTLAFVTGAAVVGVNSLAAIANRAPADASPLWAVLDAYRGQVFAARFHRGDEGFPVLDFATAPLDDADWLGRLAPGDFVTGPGLARFVESLLPGVTPLSESLWSPTAAAVGQVGWRQYQSGDRQDAWSLVPRYFRKSAAEESRSRPEQSGRAHGAR
jgi:tRNA threonylcarbamoyladenosine biosynthesis protein TsaB